MLNNSFPLKFSNLIVYGEWDSKSNICLFFGLGYMAQRHLKLVLNLKNGKKGAFNYIELCAVPLVSSLERKIAKTRMTTKWT